MGSIPHGNQKFVLGKFHKKTLYIDNKKPVPLSLLSYLRMLNQPEITTITTNNKKRLISGGFDFWESFYAHQFLITPN